MGRHGDSTRATTFPLPRSFRPIALSFSVLYSLAFACAFCFYLPQVCREHKDNHGMKEKESPPRDYGGVHAGGIKGFVLGRLMVAGLFLGRWFPMRLLYGTAVAGVWILALFPPLRRLVAANLKAVLPNEVAPKELRRLVRDSLSNALARKWVDVFVLPRLDKDFVERHIEVVGLDKYRRALAEGRGVLLITWHVGSFPILAYLALPYLGGPSLAPFRRIFDDYTQARLRAVADFHGATSVHPGGALKAIIAQFKSGGTVTMAADHLTSPRGIRVTYFGRETLMPAGPATLACRYRPVTMACFCVRTGAGRFRLEFSDPFPIPQVPKKIEDSHLQDFAQAYVRYYEEVVRRYPSQWECYFPTWPESFQEEHLRNFYTKFGVVA